MNLQLKKKVEKEKEKGQWWRVEALVGAGDD